MEQNSPAVGAPFEPSVRPRAPHVDAVMKHVYRVIGAGKQWTHEHIAAVEQELWRALDDERAAERERCASLCRGAMHAAAESGSAEALRLIGELHQRVLGPNAAANRTP